MVSVRIMCCTSFVCMFSDVTLNYIRAYNGESSTPEPEGSKGRVCGKAIIR